MPRNRPLIELMHGPMATRWRGETPFESDAEPAAVCQAIRGYLWFAGLKLVRESQPLFTVPEDDQAASSTKESLPRWANWEESPWYEVRGNMLRAGPRADILNWPPVLSDRYRVPH